ncbi:putative ribonuclease H protein [Glycine soja]
MGLSRVCDKATLYPLFFFAWQRRGTKRNMYNLLNLFDSYGQASGQMISPEKCLFFLGAMSPRKIYEVKDQLGFLLLGPSPSHTWASLFLLLVNSIINGMLAYSFKVYSWPRSMIKDLDSCIRNFVWVGNPNQRKICTVKWQKVCNPLAEGGLGLRQISAINNAAALMLSWDFIHSKDQ